jgi:hypothetical protein
MASVQKTGEIHIVFVASCAYESAQLKRGGAFGDLTFASYLGCAIGPPRHEPADRGETC